MRCTQKVHFSMTPRMRTVTFGFFGIFTIGRVLLHSSGSEVSRFHVMPQLLA